MHGNRTRPGRGHRPTMDLKSTAHTSQASTSKASSLEFRPPVNYLGDNLVEKRVDDQSDTVRRYGCLATQGALVPLLATRVFILILLVGCQEAERSRPAAEERPAPTPKVEVVPPGSEGLTRYQARARSPLPTLKGLSANPAPETVPKPELQELQVRLLGSIQARGGISADWVGFEPGERLFRAVWQPPAPSKEAPQPPPLELRLKAKNPTPGLKRLGRKVYVRGYWMTPPDAGTHLSRTTLPAPVQLNRRKGQDLLDAVQRERNLKMQALDQSRGDKNTASPKLGGRGSAIAAGNTRSVPVFYAETISVKRHQVTTPE